MHPRSCVKMRHACHSTGPICRFVTRRGTMCRMHETGGSGVVPEVELRDRLRIARRHAGLQQRDMAQRLGVQPPTYAAWETGGKVPRDVVGVAKTVEHITGVSALWILGFPVQPGHQSNNEGYATLRRIA